MIANQIQPRGRYQRSELLAMVSNPVNRRAGIEALLEQTGGRLIDIYYSFGEYDGVLIWESPDEATAASGMLAAIAPGHLKATKATALFTLEQGMEAMQKAQSLTYEAPSA